MPKVYRRGDSKATFRIEMKLKMTIFGKPILVHTFMISLMNTIGIEATTQFKLRAMAVIWTGNSSIA